MKQDEIVERLVYLNKERILTKSSREFFYGKKLCKYIDLIKKGRIVYAVKTLCHDFSGLRKKVDTHNIIDFSTGVYETKEEVIIYTSIYGKYDSLLEPLVKDSKCRYFAFTDCEIPEGSIWEKGDESLIPEEIKESSLRNRYVKMFPHKLFPGRFSIYIDGNLQVIGFPSVLIQKAITDNATGIGMHLHPRENCIYDEAKSVYYFEKITKQDKIEMLRTYKNIKMPRHFGMFECNVIVRDHNNEKMKWIMEEWWKCFLNGVKRDQLHFTLVLYTMGFRFADVCNFGASVNLNPLFLRKEHMINKG